VKTGKNILYATIGECVLIVILGTIGWVARMPLIFPSLGPTAYEQVEKPNTPSAKLYNVVVGHLLALGAGFLSLWLLHAWQAPVVTTAGFISTARLGAATLAVVITVISTLALKANQPASLATALLVSLGSMQKGRDALAIVIAVLLLAAIGEPIRRVFAKEGVGR
jgi:hypothetical protein